MLFVFLSNTILPIQLLNLQLNWDPDSSNTLQLVRKNIIPSSSNRLQFLLQLLAIHPHPKQTILSLLSSPSVLMNHNWRQNSKKIAPFFHPQNSNSHLCSDQKRKKYHFPYWYFVTGIHCFFNDTTWRFSPSKNTSWNFSRSFPPSADWFVLLVFEVSWPSTSRDRFDWFVSEKKSFVYYLRKNVGKRTRYFIVSLFVGDSLYVKWVRNRFIRERISEDYLSDCNEKIFSGCSFRWTELVSFVYIFFQSNTFFLNVSKT